MRRIVARAIAVAAEAKAERVATVNVTVGALAHLSEGSASRYFETMTSGTLAEGASLVVNYDDDVGAPRALDVMLSSVDVM